MIASALLFSAAVFLSSVLLTALVRVSALKNGVIDNPNARSSHVVPTPRGGGLSVVITCTAGILYLWVTSVVDLHLAATLIAGGVAIATVGFMDDRGSLSISIRLFVHIAAAAGATYVLGGLHIIQLEVGVVDLGLLGDIIAIVMIIWTLNLFNFMDGIDGIAASEAIFISCSGAWLVYSMGAPHAVSIVGSLLAAACLGFLVWNWPPAKIFMGDVGSGYLGYTIAVLALAAARGNMAVLLVWLILGGLFFVDATVTLLRRLARGEKVYQAHRSHAYQWMARRWNSHLRVTLVCWFINIAWLLPCAWWCVHHPEHALAITSIALVPIFVLVVVAGAGRAEMAPS